MQASTALSHLTVLDLTRVRAGPTAVRQLADWGAQVIKIEMPEAMDEGDGVGGPREDSDFQNVHRNKRGMTMNLKSPEGVAILKKLVARADVLVENYRPDVKRKLGIDYEAVSAVNPRIVYGSISGYGQDGPASAKGAVDQIIQGAGGLMSITGDAGGTPFRMGVAIADLVAGLMAMFRYLKYSLVLILAFVGVKMLLVNHYHVPNLMSLAIIVATLGAGVLASLWATSRDGETERG